MGHNRFVKEVFTVKKIYEPVKMNHIELKNRLVRSATWEGIANPDGSVTSEAYEIYEELAKGGIGAIITGFTSVAFHDYYFGGMMRLCDDVLIPQYKKLTDIIHEEGIPVITQLALGAYYREIRGRYMQVEPDDMTSDEIQYVIRQFIDAAIRADKAGFDGVQIHAAHFFFLSRFISPAVNHRTDEYGGSTENRTHIILDIMSGIQEAAPRLHITIKINSSDFTYGGLEEPECLAICRLLDQAGIDSIEVSGNGTSVGGIKAHVNEHIILAGHSLGANKVIYYLSHNHDPRVEHFFLLSPANLTYMMFGVTEREKKIIKEQVERGASNQMLPFPFMGWVACIADTAWDWQFSGLLNNVHTAKDGDFSQAEKITHTGALLVGTYDNFTDGDPSEFLRNLNNHMPTHKENKLIFIEKTGHTYQMKNQEVADDILRQLQEWRCV